MATEQSTVVFWTLDRTSNVFQVCERNRMPCSLRSVRLLPAQQLHSAALAEEPKVDRAGGTFQAKHILAVECMAF